MTHEPRDRSGLTARHEIRVRGELDAGWSGWFAGPLEVSGDAGEAVLTGILDQAALHSVLRRVRDLGLPLISMQRVEPERATPDESTEPLEDLT